MSRKGNISFNNLKNLISLYERKRNKKYTKITKSCEFPGINSSSPIIAQKNYGAFHQTRHTLLVGISVVAIFVTGLSTCNEIQKTLTTITLNYF